MAEMTPFKCGDAARIIDGEYKGRMGAIVGIGDPEMPSVFTRSLETDNDEEVPVEILKRLPGSLITARNGNRLLSALLRCIFISVLLARAVPGAAQDPISIGSASIRNPGSAKSNEEISKHSVPQYLPCRGQTKTFGKLSDSFSAGHLPSRSEITGSWVLIGFWLYKDSHPDLNCAGITRGKILDWVMLAQGYSLMIDMAGTNQTSTFEIGPRQDLTVALDLGGDSSPVLRCRITERQTLVCLGDSYYSGLEFRKMQVHCEPPIPNSKAPIQPMLCYPYKREPPPP